MPPKNPLAELLGRLLRDERIARESVEVVFAHRGAERGLRAVAGDEIVSASSRSIELIDGTSLPLHRVREVRVAGETVWSRPARGPVR